VSSEHRPVRPEWQCVTCNAEWPCDIARKLLGEVYQDEAAELARHMAGRMAHAADELGFADPAKLYKRFVGWTLAKDQACRVCGKPGHDFLPVIPPRLVPCDGKVIEPKRWPKGKQ
jgi:hypothetical protein